MLTVSKHAIERFIERVLGLTPEELLKTRGVEQHIRKCILHPKLLELFRQGGDGVYPYIPDPRFRLMIHDHTVITILDKNQAKKFKHDRKKRRPKKRRS
jgi:hypothetical protein